MKALGMNRDDYAGRVLDVRLDIQKRKRELGKSLGYDYDTLSDDQLSDIVQYNLFPNTMITVQPDDALVTRSRPHPTDPNKCLWDKFTFHRHPSAAVAEAAGVEFEPFDPRDVAPAERPAHDQFTQRTSSPATSR